MAHSGEFWTEEVGFRCQGELSDWVTGPRGSSASGKSVINLSKCMHRAGSIVWWTVAASREQRRGRGERGIFEGRGS